MINKGKDSKKWRSLTSPTGRSIIVKSSPNNNGEYFYVESGGGGGTIIELLEQIEAWNFTKILELTKETIVPNYTAVKTNKESQKPTFLTEKQVQELASPYKTIPNFNYLNSRGISNKVIQRLNLYTSEDTCLFWLYDLEDGKWYKKSAIRYYFSLFSNRRGKRFLASRAGCVSIITPCNTIEFSDFIFFFESPVDAVSFYQLHYSVIRNKKIALISTCGSLTRSFLSSINEKMNFFKPKCIYLCFDNDFAGKEMAVKVNKALLVNCEVKYLLPNGGKDYNELINK